mgnify:CR=1 FL=1
MNSKKKNVTIEKKKEFNVINLLNMKYILVLLLPALLFCQQEYRYDSNKSNLPIWVKEMYKTNFEDGNGLDREYYESGRIKSERLYKNIVRTTSLVEEYTYQDVQESEIVKTFYYWKVGDKKSLEFTEVNGKRNGIQTRWYEDGRVMKKTKFSNGSGVDTVYHLSNTENNKPTIFNITSFKNGKLHGLSKSWYQDGTIMYETQFVEGNGVFKWYDEEKKLRELIIHKDGNVFIQIYDNDQLVQEGNKFYDEEGSIENYLENKGKLGVWKTWYENGEKKSEENYLKGEKVGLQKYWFDNGYLKFEENIKEGKKDGLFKEWWNNGQLKLKGNYINGLKDGIFSNWYFSGQKESEQEFSKGKKDGLYRSWYSEGMKWKEIKYSEGKLVYQKCWNEEGNEIKCE